MKKISGLLGMPSDKSAGCISAAMILLLLLSLSGCHQKVPVLEETQESETVLATAPQWISAGHWQEYAKILCGYAESLHMDVVFAEQNGEYDIHQGIICDLNGDGLTPELLWLQEDTDGYVVRVAYIANDGNLSVNQKWYSEITDREAEALLLNEQSALGVWDILVEERKNDDRCTSFYRYENEECLYCGTAVGTAQGWASGTMEEAEYDMDGVYTIEDASLWQGYIKKRAYEIDEAEKALRQVIPEYMEELDGFEDCCTLSGAEYIDLEEGTSVYQIDFSKEVEFASRQALPIGLLWRAGQEYVLVESTQGEMGYILWNGSF